MGSLTVDGRHADPSFALQEFLGFRMEKGEGHASATLDLDDRHHNPNGIAHGAVPFTLMDTAMGAAVMSVTPAGHICATIEIHTRFVAAATSGTLTAEATVISAGRRIVHTEARTTDSSNRLIATATAGFAIIAPRSWPPVRLERAGVRISM